jgi:uncharacterized linocin/CFP29 family protein
MMMEIDFDALKDGLANVIKGSLESDWPEVKAYAEQIIEGEKQLLKDLSELRLKGHLTDEQFFSELEDQKELVKNKLLAMSAMSTAAAQKAANAAVKFLGDTVLGAVKSIL